MHPYLDPPSFTMDKSRRVVETGVLGVIIRIVAVPVYVSKSDLFEAIDLHRMADDPVVVNDDEIITTTFSSELHVSVFKE